MKDKKVLRFLIMLLMVLFKYVEMWTFVATHEYTKSLFIVFASIILSTIVLACTRKNNYNLLNILFAFVTCTILSLLTSTINFVISLNIALLFYDKNKDNVKTMLLNYAIALSGCYLITLFLYNIGILPSINSIRMTEQGIINRNSLGFFNPNSVLLYFSPIVVSFLGLSINSERKKKILMSILILSVSSILFCITDSRTGLFVMIGATLLYYFSGILNNKVLRFIMKYYLPLFLALSLCLAVMFGQNTDNQVNHVLTNRPFFWNTGYVKKYSIPILGIQINENALDNSYLYLLYGGGLVSFIIYCFFARKTMKYVLENPSLLYILVVMATYGLMEQNINYCLNPVLLIQVYYCIAWDKSYKKRLEKANEQ